MLKNPIIGNRVKWTNQPWKGIVKEVQGQRALITLEDGFDEWELLSKLVPDDQNLDLIDIHDSKNELRYIEVRPIKQSEIDLHIENLFIEWKTIPKEKILERQLQAFKEEFQKCLKNATDELIVIHGKGSGILKEHIVSQLKAYMHKSFEDMHEGRYKQSAIKIYFDRP
jgi:hypothetical protein